jgi:hypothetical protein
MRGTKTCDFARFLRAFLQQRAPSAPKSTSGHSDEWIQLCIYGKLVLQGGVGYAPPFDSEAAATQSTDKGVSCHSIVPQEAIAFFSALRVME